MIDIIHNYTLEYIESIPKQKRKSIGQFFTQPEIAKFMSSLMECDKETIKVLDAGAGSGILTATLCERCLEITTIKNIHVDLYENNEDILPVLKKSMDHISNTINSNGKNFTYNIIEENFILYNSNYWHSRETKEENELYDVIISNPPYKKISKSDKESLAMSSIVHGQPNIYFLFIAMATKLLKPEGEMIFINPRSFTSGAYFKKFRQYLFSNVQISNVHLFDSRGDVFNTEKVLQETLILRAVKTAQNVETVKITTSSDATFKEINEIDVHSNLIIDKNTDNLYVLLPANEKEVEVIKLINSWSDTIPELGFKLSTGKVVDFRATEFIKSNKEEGTVPLIWACNFNQNKIIHPVESEKNQQYIADNKNSSSLMLENKDYVLVKRLTSKEEARRVQSSLYFANELNEYKRIGIENHLNYIYKQDGDFEKEELYGLFTVLNSSYLDIYYRILNGSTQVNASEMNSIKIPNINVIKEMGRRVIKENNISVENCDKIIEELFLEDINIRNAV